MTVLTTKKWLCRNHRFSQRSWGRLPILKGAAGWRRFEKSSTFFLQGRANWRRCPEGIFEMRLQRSTKRYPSGYLWVDLRHRGTPEIFCRIFLTSVPHSQNYPSHNFLRICPDMCHGRQPPLRYPSKTGSSRISGIDVRSGISTEPVSSSLIISLSDYLILSIPYS